MFRHRLLLKERAGTRLYYEPRKNFLYGVQQIGDLHVQRMGFSVSSQGLHINNSLTCALFSNSHDECWNSRSVSSSCEAFLSSGKDPLQISKKRCGRVDWILEEQHKPYNRASASVAGPPDLEQPSGAPGSESASTPGTPAAIWRWLAVQQPWMRRPQGTEDARGSVKVS